MPRIIGIDLPREKRIEIALTCIYGIGRSLSNRILKIAKINPDTKSKELSDEEVSRLSAVIQKEYKVEGDLRREISQNIKRLIDIGTYRGFRHRRNLPVRGQRTHTNARTRKGPKRTVSTKRIKAVAAPEQKKE